MSKLQVDPQLACKMRALELYGHVRNLDAQRQSTNRSLMLAAAGVVVLVGGAAATVAEKPTTSQVGFVVAICGGLTELCGLLAYVRSA